MNSLRAVLPHPEQRFKSQRLVFWHDNGASTAPSLTHSTSSVSPRCR